jgi:hypothetical protein
MTDKSKAKPVTTLRDGRIAASIWKNENEKGSFHAVTLSRAYTDADGNLQNTNSFSGTDLLKLSRITLLAYDEAKRLAKADASADATDDEDRRE